MTEPCDLSAVAARALIGAKKLSPVELLESCLKRIGATNPVLNAVVALDEEAARSAAREAEREVMVGETLGLLHGLPVGVKDLSATKGLRTTWGSLLFKDHVPTEDEPMVAALRREGGIVAAKTNTPEFGAGANTTNRVYGPTGNPFDPAKTCAGSSGGSAVALATGQLPLATGSDFGGSLRTPAGFCGVVGFRPSPGLVPSTMKPAALMPFGVTGPMGRSVSDAYLLLKAQIDIDKADPYSSDDALRMPDLLVPADLSTLRVAISPDLGCAPVAREIADLFMERMARLSPAFADVEERAPAFGRVHEVFEILRGVMFVAQHKERYDQHRDQLDRNVTDNVARGLEYSLADVAWAHAEQSRIYRNFLAFFEEADVLICPAASVSPFPHTELFVSQIDGQAMPTYMRWLAITYAPTTALACSAALPCGLDRNGLPFGIQVVGPNGADQKVLEVALALEQLMAGDAHTARPVPALARHGA